MPLIISLAATMMTIPPHYNLIHDDPYFISQIKWIFSEDQKD